MHALSTWLALELSSELSSCFSADTRRKRKKIKAPEFTLHHKTNDLFLCSRSLRVQGGGGFRSGSLIFDRKCGFLFGYSKCMSVSIFKPKGSHFAALIALGWALEQQATGNEFLKKETSSVDKFLDESESENGKGVDLDGVENSDNEGEKNRDIDSKEEEGEEGSAKINVRDLAQSLFSAKSMDDVEDALKDKGVLPLQVYSSMIRGLGKDRKFNSALALFNWLRRKKAETNGLVGPNLFIYNSLLGAVKQSGQFSEMEKIMSDMAEEGIFPNVVTYNTLMAIYLEQGEGEKALDILEEIPRKGLTPSPVSYSQALMAYRRMEDGNGALNFFVEFREKFQKGVIGQDGNEEEWKNEFIKLEKFTIRVCYQVMRRWLVKGQNIGNNVLQLLTNMDNAGIPLDQAEYERLLWACTREDHYSVAKELYKRIRGSYSEISLSVCNHAIWLMGKAKKWWAALEIYEDLLDKGPKPNNLSYELIMSHFNVLLTAARKRGIWRWGVRLLNKMEDKGLKPSSKEWNAVLVACSKASETTAAIQIFKRMVEQGEKPTIISYGALLSVLEKGKLYDEALRVWDHMIKVGVEPNGYAYTILASIFTAKGRFDKVDAIIQEMLSLGIEITAVTYNAIISGCARNGMSSTAYEWFLRMKVQNITPNEITYEMVIEALTKDAKPRLAYELYLRAQNEGLNLSSKAYDAVMKSSEGYGDSIDTSILGPRPPDKSKKLQIRKTLTEFCNLADVPRRSSRFNRKELYASHNEGNI